MFGYEPLHILWRCGAGSVSTHEIEQTGCYDGNSGRDASSGSKVDESGNGVESHYQGGVLIVTQP